jgi:hypothetical protein
MDATTNFSLRLAPASESKVETTDWLLSRQMLQRVATRMSLVSEAIGFSILGILIIVNRHQAALNGLGDVSMVGSISAILVGSVLLVAACLHWRFCTRRPLTLPVWRQSARFTFARPEPVTAFAILSCE